MIKTIIIEDETPTRELLKTLIYELNEDIEIIADCDNIRDGLTAIMYYKPDLIFLDVIMPGGTGFDLLEQMPTGACEVIFITAHDNYAVEAFKHAAIGYVLKPVDIDELRIAVGNAKKRIKTDQSKTDFTKFLQQLRNNESSYEKIALPTAEGFLFINAKEIVRCESDKVYTWIYTQQGKKILCSYNMGEFRKILPEDMFFQVHKSHIISLQCVRSYNGKDNTVELTDGSLVPVSRRNKNSFLNNFKLLAKHYD